MSMVTLTIIQLIVVFCAYLFVTVGIPAFVLGRKMRGHSAAERFLLYFMSGNFYVMNLVFALQLMKISYPATLILGTLVPAFVGRCVLNQTPIRKNLKDFTMYFRRLAGGQLGRRTAFYRISGNLRRQIVRFGKWIGHFLFLRFFDCVLIAFLLLLLWWMYGHNLLDQYGYKASDLLVHNYWINALNDNHIFVAGVYPHGFHNVLYYLHAVFGIETYVLLRVFAFVQNVMLHLMLLCVLRLCCRSRYAAYAGTFLFVMGSYFRSHTYSRYYATLPQEFGVIFILPAIYYLFAFFVARRQELKEMPPEKKKKRHRFFGRKKKADEPEVLPETGEMPDPEEAVIPEETLAVPSVTEMEEEADATVEKKGPRRWLQQWKRKRKRKERKNRIDSDSWICLAGFCMSFSMTLAVHFYGTMIAGIFCVAIAIGYFFLIFRKNYFRSILLAGLLSVAIAVLPMLLAFLGGTPLQGSLGWGLNIITGGDKKGETQQTAEMEDVPDPVVLPEDYELPEGVTPGETFTIIYEGQELTVYQGVNDNVIVYKSANKGGTEKLSLKERMEQLEKFGKRAYNAVIKTLDSYVFSLQDNEYINYIMYAFFALIALGLFYQLFRQYCYGAMLMSTGLYMLFMCIVLNAKTFGLPALMDSNRGSIYFSYSVPLAATLLLDGVLYLPFFPLKNKVAKVGRHILNVLSLACVCLAVYYTIETGQVREPRNPAGQEMNEAVTCLTNIIRTEKDFSWTIVSANDELRMGWDHGYHYETITFLEEMEKLDADTMIRIPTPVVFFYIEKIPIDYNVAYENSGQSISEEGAARVLPANSGIGMYQGERRWILMSRMYYWAEEFKKAYPGEMEVYMETEEFICYRLEQNPYRLYNFAMDYGYNNRYYR